MLSAKLLHNCRAKLQETIIVLSILQKKRVNLGVKQSQKQNDEEDNTNELKRTHGYKYQKHH